MTFVDDPTPDVEQEPRTVPAVVYGLYLVGLTHGLTILIGLIVAYACRDQAGPAMRSHYQFQIRTFWMAIVLFIVGVALVVWGGLLSLILIGIPFFILGWIICGGVWLWFLIRCIVGCVHLARGEAYPRPTSWLV